MPPHPMIDPLTIDDEDILEVPLDPATHAWLAKIARMTKQTPADVVASMVRDIRVDDEQTHDTVH